MNQAFERADKSGAAVIKVIGVGGAGGNALNTMAERLVEGDIEFIAANTDQQALSKSLAKEKIILGKTGLGAGARPEVGLQTANEARSEIADKLRGADILFITAGMGGGTGTGASPVVAEVAQELGILTVAVVTKPFSFEGAKRMKTAEQGIAQLKNRVHSLIVILNDRLEDHLGPDATMKQCFEAADEVLFNACAGIAELIQKSGLINVDFEDVRTVMGARGTAMMGAGEASGPDRAENAASAAISCPLLDGAQLKGARGLLINVTGSSSLKMFEYRTAMETVKNFADPDAIIVAGAVVDETMGDNLRVTVIATGLDPIGTDDTFVRPAEAVQPVMAESPSGMWKPAASEPVEPQTAPAAAPQPSFEASSGLFGSSAPEVKRAAFEVPQENDLFGAHSASSSGGLFGSAEVKPTEVKITPSFEPVQPDGSFMYGQASGRPISQPEAAPQEKKPDNTIFGSYGAGKPASEVFATVSQPGGGSGLWSTNSQPASSADKSVTEKKESSGFDTAYGIPAFLRKKG